MKRRAFRILPFIAVLNALLMVSCAANGPIFSPIDLEQQEAIFYLYRPAGAPGRGSTVNASVNGKPATKLKAGGYWPYRTSPGRIRLQAGGFDLLFVIRSGERRYFRYSIGPSHGNVKAVAELIEVSSNVGTEEIRDCRLLPTLAHFSR